jgi:hypothetical protein
VILVLILSVLSVVSCVYVSDISGYGLFNCRRIRSGEMITSVWGRIISLSDLDSSPHHIKQSSYQLENVYSRTLAIHPHCIATYINSCKGANISHTNTHTYTQPIGHQNLDAIDELNVSVCLSYLTDFVYVCMCIFCRKGLARPRIVSSTPTMIYLGQHPRYKAW